MALNFKSLLTRTLTAAIFVAVLLSAINHSYLSFLTLFFIVAIWGLHEFYKISEKLNAKPFKALAFTSAIIFYVSIAAGNIGFVCADTLRNISICVLFMVFAEGIFSKNEKPLSDIAYTVLGMIYVVVPFVLLNKLILFGEVNSSPDEPFNFHKNYNPHVVLGMILLIWASDSFAYLVGSMIGKRKLYEKISPGKTWEGTIGGGVLTMASSYIIAAWFPEIEFVHWLVISMLVVIFGTLGDLFESLLKRQAGIKDSGKIMPGHGGILDRFDSLIFVTPFVYLYLNWVLN